MFHPAVFAVEATTNDGGDLSYLWQFNCDMGWINLESPYDDGTYDNPGATQSISDELYDIIIAALLHTR